MVLCKFACDRLESRPRLDAFGDLGLKRGRHIEALRPAISSVADVHVGPVSFSSVAYASWLAAGAVGR